MVGAMLLSTPATTQAAEPTSPQVDFAVSTSLPDSHSNISPQYSSVVLPTAAPDPNNSTSSTPQIVDKAPETKLNKSDAYNCYMYVRNRFVPNLPPTRLLRPNSEAQNGAVALFTYPSGLRHYAYVLNRSGDSVTIAESNYRKGQYTTRTISINSPSLDGFWMP